MFRYPLDQVLGKTANVRILRELTEHGGLLPVSSVVPGTGMTRSAVQLALHELVHLGVVRRVGARKSLLYVISDVHPLAAALAGLYAAERARLAAVKTAISEAVAPFTSQRVSAWLYGSVARREDGPDSDLDVAVAVEVGSVQAVTDALRDRMAADAERLAVRALVVGVGGADIRRLSAGGSLWWKSVCNDAIVVVGVHPETVAVRLRGGMDAPA